MTRWNELGHDKKPKFWWNLRQPRCQLLTVLLPLSKTRHLRKAILPSLATTSWYWSVSKFGPSSHSLKAFRGGFSGRFRRWWPGSSLAEGSTGSTLTFSRGSGSPPAKSEMKNGNLFNSVFLNVHREFPKRESTNTRRNEIRILHCSNSILVLTDWPQNANLLLAAKI